MGIPIKSMKFKQVIFKMIVLVGIMGISILVAVYLSRTLYPRQDGNDQQITFLIFSVLTIMGILGMVCWEKIKRLLELQEQSSRDERTLQSNSLYQTMVDNIDVPMHLMDRDYHICLMNKELEKWNQALGLSGAVIGKHYLEAYPFLSAQTKNEYRMVFETGKTFLSKEHVLVGTDTIYTQTKKIPVMQNSRVAGVITVLQDISNQARWDKENEVFHRFSQVISGVMTCRELAQALSREAQYLFGYEVFSFDRYHQDSCFLEGIYSEDTPTGGVDPVEVEAISQENYLLNTLEVREGKGVLIAQADSHCENRLISMGFKERSSRSMMFCPIYWEGKVLAMVTIQSYTPNYYHSKMLESFQVLVSQCSGTLMRIMVEQDLKTSHQQLEKRIQERTAALSKANTLLVKEINERKETAQLLEENQRRLNRLIGSLPGVVFRGYADERRTMEFVSQGCRELTGYAVEALTHNPSANFIDLIYPEDRERVLACLKKAVQESSDYQVRYRIRTAQNRVKWIWEKGGALSPGPGESVIIEGFMMDVTPE